MENYIVSARKYRPSTFESVVGQRALTTTLKNAIATQKLAHAYLFCGPRGVGKTTCARIHAPIERRLIAIILIVLTSWIGLLFYYFYGKARMPQWLGTGVQKY